VLAATSLLGFFVCLMRPRHVSELPQTTPVEAIEHVALTQQGPARANGTSPAPGDDAPERLGDPAHPSVPAGAR
jgi:hypothetical protein